MSASPFILYKVEQALAGYILDNVDGIEKVYTGIEHETVNEDGEQVRRALPCVECICQNSQFDGHPTGSHIAQANVIVRANADEKTGSEFGVLVDEVWSALVTDTIAADLSAAVDDFHCSGLVWQSQSWQIVGRSWVAELALEMHCAGQSIPAE